jgi:hypothetical protein
MGGINGLQQRLPTYTSLQKLLVSSCSIKTYLKLYSLRLLGCWHDGACLLCFLPPSDCPSSELNGSRKLGAISISYASLKAAVKKAHDKHISGDWLMSNMKSYLRVMN